MNENQFRFKDRGQKVLALFYLPKELLASVHRWVDAAPDLALRRSKGSGDFRQRSAPDEHQVNVA